MLKYVDVGLRSVSLCSGIEGLGLGVSAGSEFCGLGAVRPVLYVEREAFPAALLASKMETGEMDAAPIWSDLGTACGPECGAYLRAVAPIDLVFGGIPCQPWSAAGKQKGIDDERDLWPLAQELIEFTSPSWVFLENVPGFAVWDGLGRVAGGLRGLGYRVAAMLLGAGDVGASHRRKRLNPRFVAWLMGLPPDFTNFAHSGMGSSQFRLRLRSALFTLLSQEKTDGK